MGMFDTIHFPKPISCPECGAEIFSVQTKEFESLMGNYFVGSLLRGVSILKGCERRSESRVIWPV